MSLQPEFVNEFTMISRRPGRPAEKSLMVSLMTSRRLGRPGGKIIDDFINDFPPAGEAGGKIINDFPPAGEAGGK